eukprot:c41149_g1_i1 orf=296-448(+)
MVFTSLHFIALLLLDSLELTRGQVPNSLLEYPVPHPLQSDAQELDVKTFS